ncbi:hypothetical protein ACP_3333 [Acidobacterium capsulatum ATCC 51196]|uniref:Uncharacterized protein n=1 Tax=Acidobacterium capsulatum (strain ATCC 51196 / DSM 11244 / BCRC 80197 / JCM 7670 / NBRC 15755 / NCIMB 13165 / 161) TaxID=240015 RepID=C1F6A3_ACIC5|nr:hypothetical protein ACP_3333 [Acidobacterium capsulatum ATCC 51196]
MCFLAFARTSQALVRANGPAKELPFHPKFDATIF